MKGRATSGQVAAVHPCYKLPCLLPWEAGAFLGKTGQFPHPQLHRLQGAAHNQKALGHPVLVLVPNPPKARVSLM